MASHPTVSRNARSRRGFSLLEMIVVLGIVSIVAGMAVPVVAVVLTRSKIEETNQELRSLVPALADYFQDCRRLPTTLSQLEVNSPALAGWRGPYTTALRSGKAGVNLSLDQDGWNQAYVLSDGSARAWSPSTATSQVTIRSKGPDQVAGNADDLTQVVDVTFLRRRETVDELGILNRAIQAYNDRYLDTAPLPANLDQLLGALYGAGLLPRPPPRSVDPLRTDGWGAVYAAAPAGAAPVVRVTSSNLGGANAPSRP